MEDGRAVTGYLLPAGSRPLQDRGRTAQGIGGRVARPPRNRASSGVARRRPASRAAAAGSGAAVASQNRGQRVGIEP